MSSEQSLEDVMKGVPSEKPEASSLTPVEVTLPPAPAIETLADYQKVYLEELARISRGHVPNRHDRRAARSITLRRIRNAGS